MNPMNLGGNFLALCISIFAGALALHLAMHLLSQVWVQLLITGIAIVTVIAVVVVYRWRRDRW